jgi:hypothetical protein
MFQQICQQLAQSVGDNCQLVMKKMNQGHLHSLLFLKHKITFFVSHEWNAASLGCTDFPNLMFSRFGHRIFKHQGSRHSEEEARSGKLEHCQGGFANCDDNRYCGATDRISSNCENANSATFHL